ncbi:MAG: sigma-54-dependent Fis family transcriptional regulator, partial [Deltaproteobacteria bacterium]|nr:sigma-54-dependent Fis family transcriptional regulator [Deltaproteobacteria bacterium]
MSGKTYKVLIVDDDEEVRGLLAQTLESSYHVKAVPDGESAVEHLKTRDFAVIITDMQLPGINGIEVIKAARKLSPETICFIITGHATVDTAVSAMKLGVYDYMQKPIRGEELIHNVKRAIEFYSLKKENIVLREDVRERFSFDNLIGKSKVMVELYEIIKRVADSDSNIFITGESGTGKELVAKTIHYNSTRSNGPFIPVNCGAIPADLIESELFGHEKGAFTGAATSRLGRFERANNGTIFLDEIGELALPLQVKLLRVLQEKEFDRVGGIKTIQVDIRVIAATNRNI